MSKKKVGKRKRKGWRKRSPRCTLCTAIRWMGNIKGRHPLSLLRQLQKEKHGTLVFRIDHENGGIRILQRTYKWDSDEDDIDDE